MYKRAIRAKYPYAEVYLRYGQVLQLQEKFDAAIESSATTAIFNCLAYSKSIASAGATSSTFISISGKSL